MSYLRKVYGREWILKDGRWHELRDGKEILQRLATTTEVEMAAEIEGLREENKSLTRRLEDWEETQRSIMDEPCREDEVHCTCVPVLRTEIKKVRKECRVAADWLDLAHGRNLDDWPEVFWWIRFAANEKET